MTLAEFVAARLDEDEAEAKGPPGWKLERWTAVKYADKASGRNWRVDAEPRCVVDSVAREDAQFMARHDPARALREVDAKRAILDLTRKVQEWTHGSAGATAGYAAAVVSDALRALAAVWPDHPDYDPEWAA